MTAARMISRLGLALALLAPLAPLSPLLAQATAADAAAGVFVPPPIQPGEPPRGSPLSQFNADSSFRPPFDKPTTLRLNTIVKRAKDAIDAFDARLAKPVAAIEAGQPLPPGSPDRAAIAADVTALHTAAAAAKADLFSQQPVLDASGRYYSKIVFAGMVKFTRDVEAELREHMEKLGNTKPPH